jgi:hypothetical protein
VCSLWKGTGSPRCGNDRHPLRSIVSTVRRLTVRGAFTILSEPSVTRPGGWTICFRRPGANFFVTTSSQARPSCLRKSPRDRIGKDGVVASWTVRRGAEKCDGDVKGLDRVMTVL